MPRPFSVTLLALAVFCLAGFKLLGVVAGLQQWAFLNTLALSVPPVYLIAARGIWGITFAAVGVGLWRLKRWGRSGALAACTLYAAHGWLERLAYSRSDFAGATQPWALAGSVTGLVLVWGILWRGKVRRSFST